MNKGLIISVALLALVGAGAGGYYIYTQSSKDSTSSQTSIDESTKDEPVEKKEEIMEDRMEPEMISQVSGTFADLLALGENFTCTFDYKSTNNSMTKGAVYVASGGDKFKGEFTMTQSDETKVDSYVISDGVYNYIWSSQFEGGFKTKFEESDSIFSSDESEQETTEIGISDDTDLDFECKRWVVDNSKFVPPTDVEFTDLSTAMEDITAGSEALKESQCAACEQLPEGETRETCLSSLGCE